MVRDPTLLAERIVKHLFNYVSGFTGGSEMSPDVVVPMSVIARWYESFMDKIRTGGVRFLERRIWEMGLASSLWLICITMFINHHPTYHFAPPR